MLTALTTNVTRFFREPHHFEHLKTRVLPHLIANARRGGRIRLWSAACSSGQEPYSIALTLLSLWPEAASHDVKMLATDIDPHMLATGRRRASTRSASSEPVPRRPAQALLRADARSTASRIGASARRCAALVAFRQLNLIEPWPMQGPFDAIFCRNVVIYFDEPTQQRIWEKFVPRLAPDGALYIGHSERVTGPAARSCAATASPPIVVREVAPMKPVRV